MGVFVVVAIVFLLGIVFEKYIFPIADLLLETFAFSRKLKITNYICKIKEVENEMALSNAEASVLISECEKSMYEIKKDMHKDLNESEIDAIGYKFEGKPDCCDDEDECDCDECDIFDKWWFFE